MIIVISFVSLMILFVAVNLIIAIYRQLNRSWREGLDNPSSVAASDLDIKTCYNCYLNLTVLSQVDMRTSN